MADQLGYNLAYTKISGLCMANNQLNGNAPRAARAPIHPMQIVNVASVSKLSPFRYPGGKTWLIPHVRRCLLSRTPSPSELIEPFAGGAIVGLTAAFERLADSGVLIEKDVAVWHTPFNTG